MLSELKIENYRSIKSLVVPTLGHINLITGKNNTGKTSLLEAVGLLVSRGDGGGWLYDILKERTELVRVEESNRGSGRLKVDGIQSIRSVFYERRMRFDGSNTIKIFGGESYRFTMQFVKFIERQHVDVKINDEVTTLARRLRMKVDEDDTEGIVGLEVNDLITPLDSFLTRSGLSKPIDRIIRVSPQENDVNAALWDKIALSDKEDYLVGALKIIEPNIEKITFVSDDFFSGSRRATIKLRGGAERLPLKSMGDGLNRILSIALALVNADGGYLLVDEFENGLHYSVQEELWRVVFQLSKKLNVQVFATTHSSDCVSAFSNVANADEGWRGQLIRVENREGVVSLVSFDEQELQIANQQNIELR